MAMPEDPGQSVSFTVGDELWTFRGLEFAGFAADPSIEGGAAEVVADGTAEITMTFPEDP